eukprot:COSAG01_NODE_53741_length_337_cov_0.558824_1_plen_88_part_01
MSARNVGAALLGLSPGEKETLQGLLGQLTLQGLLPGGPQPGVGLLRRLFASLRPRQLGLAAIFTGFFKQKTAYGISECDWSSDVCSSD